MPTLAFLNVKLGMVHAHFLATALELGREVVVAEVAASVGRLSTVIYLAVLATAQEHPVEVIGYLYCKIDLRNGHNGCTYIGLVDHYHLRIILSLACIHYL